MSEQAKLLGTAGPPQTIEHNGKVYTVSPAMSERTLTNLETKLYQRAKDALKEWRDDMPLEAYLERLDALRKQYEDGGFGIGSPQTQAFLNDEENHAGKIFMACAMIDASEGEVLTLLMERPEELKRALEDCLNATFPSGGGDGIAPPKAKAPPSKRRGRR